MLSYDAQFERFPTPAELRAKEAERSRGPPRPKVSDRETLMSTAVDAASAKLTAIQTGYYDDRFQSELTMPHERTDVTLRRGYALRVAAVERAVAAFRERYGSAFTVLVLGAGLDSSFFRLHDRGEAPERWVEIDLAGNVATKGVAIEKSDLLRSQLPSDADISPLGVVSSSYNLKTCDISSPLYVRRILPLLPADKPLLMVAECVLIYLPNSAAQKALATFAEHVTESAVVIYEQSTFSDIFAMQMVRDLEERGLHLPGLQVARNPTAHCAGYSSQFLPVARFAMVNDVYAALRPVVGDRWASADPATEDEEEEFEALSCHYAILVLASSVEVGTAVGEPLGTVAMDLTQED